MSIGRHSAFNLFTAVVSLTVALVSIPLYLKLIGPERYGILAVLWALLGYFGFMDLGLGRAVQQRLASNPNESAGWQSSLIWTALASTLALGAAGSMLIYVGGTIAVEDLISMSTEKRVEAKGAIHWLWLLFPLLLSNSVLSGALLARLQYVKTNKIQLMTNVLSQLLPIAVAMNGFIGLEHLVPTTLLVRIFGTAILFVYVWKEIGLSTGRKFSAVHLKYMLSYGGWMSILSILSPILVTIDRMLIGAIAGAQAVAYYSIPYNLMFRAIVIPTSLSNAIFPRMARKDDAAGRALARKATGILSTIMTPVAIIGMIFAQPFISLWIGRDFAEQAKGVSEIIMLGIWCNALVIPHHSRYLATQSPKPIVLIFLLEIPLYLVALYGGLFYWGIVGAAAAWSFRVIIDTLFILRLNGELKRTLKQATISLVIVSMAFLTSQLVQDGWARLAACIFLLSLSLTKDRSEIKETFGEYILLAWNKLKFRI